jgi:hypothetical protein
MLDSIMLSLHNQLQGIKIYWHGLETMLRAEESRAGLPSACSLLTCLKHAQNTC